MINAVRSAGRVNTTHWLLSLVLIVALAGCDGWSGVTMHHKTCRGAGDSGRCEGGYGTLTGAYPETIESELLSDDAVEVRAEVSVDQGRVNVSVESPEGDIASVEAAPGKPAVLEGVAEISFNEFDVTFEAIDEQASGISYTIDYRSPQTSDSASPGEEPSGSGSGPDDAAGQPLSDLLALLPAGEDFWISFSDLDAHRDAVGARMPSASASTDALAAHAERLNKGGGPPLGSAFEENPSLSPLARGSAYALMGWDGPRTQQQPDDFFSIDNVQVVAGGFADDAFGRPKPDDELDGVRTVPVTKQPFEVSDANTVTGRLTVEDGVATLADHPDELAAALDAQRGDAPSMADIPAAARLFAVLDELDVVNGTAQVPPASRDAVDAVAAGVAVDPDRAGSWRMVVAHHVRDDTNASQQSSVPGSSNIDFATEQLAALAEDFAEEHDTEVVEVAPHGGDVAVAIVPVDDPILWLDQSDTTLAMLWADPDLPGLLTEGAATEGAK